jgi:hypothetical protein
MVRACRQNARYSRIKNSIGKPREREREREREISMMFKNIRRKCVFEAGAKTATDRHAWKQIL